MRKYRKKLLQNNNKNLSKILRKNIKDLNKNYSINKMKNICEFTAKNITKKPPQKFRENDTNLNKNHHNKFYEKSFWENIRKIQKIENHSYHSFKNGENSFRKHTFKNSMSNTVFHTVKIWRLWWFSEKFHKSSTNPV